MSKPVVLVTHAGIFHPDDVGCATILEGVHGTNHIREIFRISDYKKDIIGIRKMYPEDEYDIITFDIGGGEYDHHQTDALVRPDDPDGIIRCALDLIWQKIGRKYVELELRFVTMTSPALIEAVFNYIDMTIIRSISASDNGQKITNGPPTYFSAVINSFNPNWNEVHGMEFEYISEVRMRQFRSAMTTFKELFFNEIRRAHSMVISKEIIDPLIDETKRVGRQYLVLDKPIYWDNLIVGNSNADHILFVISPSDRIDGYWVIRSPLVSRLSRDNRCLFPKRLRGKDVYYHGYLQYGINFVHSNGFMASTDTLDHAIQLAEDVIKLYASH
jgi:uncharacterized UPF0160 family protein